jgi:uncharacterized protein (TIGR00369 family)
MSTDARVNVPLDVAGVQALIDAHFPQIHAGARTLVIEAAAPRSARVRLLRHDHDIRPGGTVSGPAMFRLADFAVYVAIMATLGEPGIEAVTTNLNINFLAKPEPADLVASVRLIRVGRRLAVGEVQIHADGSPDMVAHAIATYALPSRDR